LWTTEYLHVLSRSQIGEHPVVTWTKGSLLMPFLAALDDAAQQTFIHDYTDHISKAYPMLRDGRVLLPFRRVFMVAVRAIR